ncbi:carbohydrate kinase family protein [Streptomyces phaeochromogenes]|uniref:carbohydrate kinase family protein n=1 Tax=Streptomyces phaeochromogenes TaxID=1923 RepID=UPI0006E1210F|nr:carbohydrate kinase family protein [Streptomyces phaeochromogenes]
MTVRQSQWDLACFSYLAHAQVSHVARYPEANQGAEVTRTFSSLAGDGPIIAQDCAARGLRTALVANQIGDDPTGRHTRQRLAAVGVHYRASPGSAPRRTPHLTVITDDASTRTWFADLTHAYASLHQADTSPIEQARLAYIDGYTVIADAAAGALLAAAGAGVPVLLNLGGDRLHPKLHQAARQAHVFAVQTSLPEFQAQDADDTARSLLTELGAHAAVVTVGALGAVAVTRTTTHQIPARKVDVVHTHGAGAAFSAALAAAHLDGHDLPTALHLAGEAGTAHCTTVPGTDASTPERTAS